MDALKAFDMKRYATEDCRFRAESFRESDFRKKIEVAIDALMAIA